MSRWLREKQWGRVAPVSHTLRDRTDPDGLEMVVTLTEGFIRALNISEDPMTVDHRLPVVSLF